MPPGSIVWRGWFKLCWRHWTDEESRHFSYNAGRCLVIVRLSCTISLVEVPATSCEPLHALLGNETACKDRVCTAGYTKTGLLRNIQFLREHCPSLWAVPVSIFASLNPGDNTFFLGHISWIPDCRSGDSWVLGIHQVSHKIAPAHYLTVCVWVLS